MGIREQVKKGKVTAVEAVELFKTQGATKCKSFAWLVNRAALEKAAANKKAAPEKTVAKEEEKTPAPVKQKNKKVSK